MSFFFRPGLLKFFTDSLCIILPSFVCVISRIFFFFSSIFLGNQTLIYVTLSVHFLELVSLLGLSIVSSLENFDIHKICFGTFVICSLIYFALTIRLWVGSWKGVYNHSFDGLKDFNNIGKINIYMP